MTNFQLNNVLIPSKVNIVLPVGMRGTSLLFLHAVCPHATLTTSSILVCMHVLAWTFRSL